MLMSNLQTTDILKMELEYAQDPVTSLGPFHYPFASHALTPMVRSWLSFTTDRSTIQLGHTQAKCRLLFLPTIHIHGPFL